MADSTVTGGDSNVFELHVHVVFGCELREKSLVFERFSAFCRYGDRNQELKNIVTEKYLQSASLDKLVQM